MFHIVLVAPEIPHNAGAAGRLALATASRLHLVKPLGFSLDDKHVRRTGLDYWQDVDLRVWDSLEDLKKEADPAANFWLLSTKATRAHWDAPFRDGDYLVFGCETKGLPEAMVHGAGDQGIRIPMAPGGTRSLNLSTAIAITLYEAVRQDRTW
ncbi:tRNA (cytidine(34)-2'-O)-methyltransferase [Luteolibacter flavescens]|uniref:Putative tRNA (cytidine(34)-2'-O)-methyltransferase n=1 Tax=Luteolibacter flavescens TaxID=1859460 RepID=A0ABT3FQR1_9BACT|nr:tRNA (cytidine(34)-2'-O)-methyltransferase [Luteolibacter flavescens]MCW1885295.1 tRNA (cytidine(34)-2'-O)-methyltransferase [Luteolibacter flavescens]